MTSKVLQLLITSNIIPVLQSVNLGQNSKSKQEPTQHEAVPLQFKNNVNAVHCVPIPTQLHEVNYSVPG